MSDVQEYAARLSQVIGPRPAGTEEEQQASFFIDEVFQEAGLETYTEEFRCNPNFHIPRIVCCLFTVVLGFLSLFLSMLVLPAMIVCLITAVLFALDCFGLSPFTNFSKKGLSQNIVAKYEPPAQNASATGASTSARPQRRRKVILVANYDSGKVRRELKSPTLGILHIIRWVELGAMILVPLVLLIRLISGENAGPLVMFTNVLTIIGAIGALLVLLSFVTHQIAAYNDGANCNASGVAVMLEVAKRISASRNNAPQDAVLHGAREAYAAGVVPAGAELVYAEDTGLADFGEDSEAIASADALGATEAHLDAADYAQIPALSKTIDSLTGVGENGGSEAATDIVATYDGESYGSEAYSGESTTAMAAATTATAAAAATTATAAENALEGASQPQQIQDQQAQVQAQPQVEAGEQIAAETPLSSTVSPAYVGESISSIFEPVQKEPNVPDWYKRAMSKANKTEANTAPDPSVRSKFSDALDAAAAASHPEPEPVRPSGLSSDAEQRLQAMRESIMSGRPLSEATGTITDAAGENAADATMAAEGTESEETATTATAENASGVVTTHTQGVDGYLSSTMSSPNYEATQAQAEQATQAQQSEQSAQAQQAAQSAQTKQSAAAKRQTSKRVISTGAQTAAASKKAQKEPRKKRSISLPSLTGALKAVSPKDGSTEASSVEETAAASANNDAEVARIAARNANKLKKANLANSLPSVDGSSKASAGADMLGATGSLEPLASGGKGATSTGAASATSAGAAVSAASTAANATSAAAVNATPSATRASKATHAQSSPNEEVDLGATISISQVGSFANAGMTGAFEPLGSEFVADMAAEDIYVDDVDDSGYEENFTEHGALAGPGYVEMPQSRRDRMFGKFRRKNKKQDDISFSEAVGIEEGYDARQVGKDRGGWESFRQDSQGGRSGRANQNDGWDDDDWNGGAYGGASGGAYNSGEYDMRYAVEAREGIREFHEGPVQLEVWFVALGAELADNAGMKSFIAEHNNDLRGAMIVDIEALGAGELTMVEREGMYRPAGMSSRLKRYVHKAGEALGIRVGTTSMLWENSAAYVAERHGCQTLHLAGIKDGKPAYMAEADDVLSNIDSQLMEENAAFIMEFIRGI